MRRLFIQVLIIVSWGGTIYAQTGIEKYPVIGNRCPDFLFKRVDYYNKKTAQLSDFHGKWLILDFFSKGCSSCFASFPEINALQKKYNENVKFLLVGMYDSFGKDLDTIFNTFRAKQGLQLSVAYDSAIFEQFGVRGVPHVVIVDPEGKVRAITDGVTDLQMELLVENKPVNFKRKFSFLEENTKIDFDLKVPFLVDGNGGKDGEFLYRSLLSKWDTGMKACMVTNIGVLLDSGLFQSSGLWLAALYNFAYFGVSDIPFGDTLYNSCYSFPIVEIDDKSAFEPDFESGRNVYNYSLKIPKGKASVGKFKEILQKDLASFFNFEVSLEEREVPCWKLIVQERAKKKLITKGGPSAYVDGSPSPISCNINNLPVSAALGFIASYHEVKKKAVFIDGTGINGNIDLKLSAIMTDLEDIRRGLRESGLDLVPSKINRTCIVLKDRH